uniref:Uncharacterized protein MANES_02G061300 n=1 Tax=Rhizophora mucronata TaxID=61149 RepID=A0A2P2MDP4_RHIMU
MSVKSSLYSSAAFSHASVSLFTCLLLRALSLSNPIPRATLGFVAILCWLTLPSSSLLISCTSS